MCSSDLVNAVVHIVHAIRFRRYNPGLLTAVALFLPLGMATLLWIHRAGGDSIRSHAIGLLTAVALHGAILIWVRQQFLALQARPN